MGRKLLSGQLADSSYRYEADLRMYRHMFTIVKAKASWYNGWWYRLMAKSYYKLVMAGGRSSFVYRSKNAVVSLQTLRDEVSYESRELGPLAQCRSVEECGV